MLYRTHYLGDQLTSESSPKYPVSERDVCVPSKGASATMLAGTCGTYVPYGDNCSCLAAADQSLFLSMQSLILGTLTMALMALSLYSLKPHPRSQRSSSSLTISRRPAPTPCRSGQPQPNHALLQTPCVLTILVDLSIPCDASSPTHRPRS